MTDTNETVNTDDLYDTTMLSTPGFRLDHYDHVLIIIVSNKGGVGKTFISRFLIYLLTLCGKRLAIYDTEGLDKESKEPTYVGLTANMFSEKTKLHEAASVYDLHNPDESSELIKSMESSEPYILHDCCAGSVDKLLRAASSGTSDSKYSLIELFNVALETKTRIVFVYPLTSDKDTVKTIYKMTSIIGNRADHIVVRNNNFGGEKDSAYHLYFGDETRPETRPVSFACQNIHSLAQNGHAALVTLPILAAGTSATLGADLIKFEDVSTENNSLSFAEKSNVRAFLAKARDEFNIPAFKNLLGLSDCDFSS